MTFIRTSLSMGPTIVGFFKVVKRSKDNMNDSYLVESKLKDYVENPVFENKEVKKYKYKVTVRRGNKLAIGKVYFIVGLIESRAHKDLKVKSINNIHVTSSTYIRCKSDFNNMELVHQILTLSENIITFSKETIDTAINNKKENLPFHKHERMSLYLNDLNTPHMVRINSIEGTSLNIKIFGFDYDWTLLKEYHYQSIEEAFNLNSSYFYDRCKETKNEQKTELRDNDGDDLKKEKNLIYVPNEIDSRTDYPKELFNQEDYCISLRVVPKDKSIILLATGKVKEDDLSRWEITLSDLKKNKSKNSS